MDLVAGITAAQLSIGSGWLIVCIGLIAMMRGRLVPRQALEDALHDRDEWRSESRIKDQQIAEKDAHLREVAEVGRNVLHIMGALQSLQHHSGEE